MVAGSLRQAKLRPDRAGEIDVVLVDAARAHVHDLGCGSLALVLNLDLLSAPWVGRLAGHDVVNASAHGVPGTDADGDDLGIIGLELTASTKVANVHVVDGNLDIVERFTRSYATRRAVAGGSA